MPKSLPQNRWIADVRERYKAFAFSPELDRLRRTGLKILGRSGLLTCEEWFVESNVIGDERFQEFNRECQQVGDRFGLNGGTILMACLVTDYDPWEFPYPVESEWPTVKVATRVNDNLFVHWLVYATKSVYQSGDWFKSTFLLPQPQVVQQNGSELTKVIFVPFVPRPKVKLDRLPPRSAAFRMLVELPPGYPPEGSAEISRHASQFDRALARWLGYQVPRRMRGSKVLDDPTRLFLEPGKLPGGGIYEIMDEKYGDQDLSEDQKVRNKTKSQRHRALKRLKDRDTTR